MPSLLASCAVAAVLLARYNALISVAVSAIDAETATTTTTTLPNETTTTTTTTTTTGDCGIWLGPSPIKEEEEHGWGHSIFTGKFIPEGTIVFGSGILDEKEEKEEEEEEMEGDEISTTTTKKQQRKSYGDLFVPVYDWQELDTGAYASFEWDYDDDDDDDDNNNSNNNNNNNNNNEKEKKTREIIDRAHDAHSVLFQETWNGDDFPKVVLESFRNMRVYMPGLASLCPCTSDGYNLEQSKKINYRDWRRKPGDDGDDDGDGDGDGDDGGESESPPSPQAGSFSYLSNAMFVATRDIPAGEELVVQCEGNSDEFDPSDYPTVTFRPEEAGGYSVCLDDRVEVRLADHTPNVASSSSSSRPGFSRGDDNDNDNRNDHGKGGGGGQRGLFAKRKLESEEVLTSTPVIPVHRKELAMDDDGERQQLLLNYMFGHAGSSLLWLPQAPLILAANHYESYDYDGETPENERLPHQQQHQQQKEPNAKLLWHSDKYTEAQAAGKPLSRRQQFHHAELLEMDSLDVVRKHGMGLMIDLVATRAIDEGEEILLDYGRDWDDAMRGHLAGWEAAIASSEAYRRSDEATRRRQRALDHERRLSKERELEKRAADGNRDEEGGLLPSDAELHHHRQKDVHNSMTAFPFSSYVTAAEYNELHAEDDVRTVSEQHRNPYPSNIGTACHFEYDWLDDEINMDEDAERVTYESWYNQNDHFDSSCVLPCIVTERREYVPDEENTLSNDDDYFTDDETKLRELDDDVLTNAEYGGSASSKRYTAKLMDTHEENTSIGFNCHIFQRFEYIYMDIPREGITFVDKPHSTDQWIEGAFRQPIGLPEEMVPKIWRDLTRRERKGVRGSSGEQSKPTMAKTASKSLTTDEEVEEEDYQLSVKRWNVVETRRELLEEMQEKRNLDYSPREDL